MVILVVAQSGSDGELEQGGRSIKKRGDHLSGANFISDFPFLPPWPCCTSRRRTFSPQRVRLRSPSRLAADLAIFWQMYFTVGRCLQRVKRFDAFCQKIARFRLYQNRFCKNKYSFCIMKNSTPPLVVFDKAQNDLARHTHMPTKHYSNSSQKYSSQEKSKVNLAIYLDQK